MKDLPGCARTRQGRVPVSGGARCVAREGLGSFFQGSTSRADGALPTDQNENRTLPNPPMKPIVAAIAAIPLVLIFLFTMRLFVKGLTAGAVKG